MRTTLHIEHSISDLAAWSAAFGRFADRRKAGGVLAERVYLAQDDPAFIVIQLDFDHIQQAGAFLEFLETRVWSAPTNSPALVGRPVTRMLRPVGVDRAGSDQDGQNAGPPAGAIAPPGT